MTYGLFVASIGKRNTPAKTAKNRQKPRFLSQSVTNSDLAAIALKREFIEATFRKLAGNALAHLSRHAPVLSSACSLQIRNDTGQRAVSSPSKNPPRCHSETGPMGPIGRSVDGKRRFALEIAPVILQPRIAGPGERSRRV
ncbi:MAG: hypothetical protein EXS32_11890 [Opitutus sp.]|nr:hypothetical protein [Opitutus sp.]